jgi:hypothetical protein
VIYRGLDFYLYLYHPPTAEPLVKLLAHLFPFLWRGILKSLTHLLHPFLAC